MHTPDSYARLVRSVHQSLAADAHSTYGRDSSPHVFAACPVCHAYACLPHHVHTSGR